MHHFKARVLELAIDEINAKTDITVDYEQHKKGGQSQGSHSSLSRRRKQSQKRQKSAILAILSKTYRNPH